MVVLGDRRRLERLEGHRVDVATTGVFEEGAVNLDLDPDADEGLPDVVVGEDEPCMMLFTSGTTGRSKAAVLSHRNNIHFGLALLLGGAEMAIRATQRGTTTCGAARPGCVISSMPLFHTSGLSGQLIAGMFTGMTTVFPEPGRWREDVHLELTQKYQATMWSVVPTQLWRLLDWPELDRYDLSSLQRVGGGASVWPPELLRKAGGAATGCAADHRLRHDGNDVVRDVVEGLRHVRPSRLHRPTGPDGGDPDSRSGRERCAERGRGR